MSTIFEICKVFNKNADESLLYEIALLKKQHWGYQMDSQLLWFKQNLKDNDIHFFCRYNNELIAYINVCEINIIMDGEQSIIDGIGNVCVAQKFMRNGYGRLLLMAYICQNSSKPCILLCDGKLVPFYIKCGFREVVPASVIIEDAVYTKSMMAHNLYLNEKHIIIDRSF